MISGEKFDKNFFSSGVYENYQEFLNSWVALLAKRIYRFLQDKPGAKILDVGCGFGTLLAELQNKYHFEVAGLEYSPYALQKSEPSVRAKIKRGDLLNPPFQKNSFEAVICFDVIYYFTSPEIIRAIKNLVNFSRDYIFFNSVYRHSVYASQKHNPDPLRLVMLSKKEYIEIFSKCGAKLVKSFYGENGGDILVFKKK